MLENSSALDLTVGRSTVRQAILALLMDETGRRLHLREIQRRVGTSPGTASRELAKLVAAGLVEREAEGVQVYFRASSSPFAMMLRSIIVAMPSPDPGARPRRLPRPKRAKAAPEPAAASAGFESTNGIPSGEVAVEPGAATAADAGAAIAAAAAKTDAPPVDEAVAPTASEPAPQPADVVARVFEPVPRQRPQVGSEPTAAAATLEAHTSARVDDLGLEVGSRFAQSVRPMYGEALRGVYLYGARAGGPSASDADVETIVVLDRVEHYGAELEKTSQLCASLSHEFGVLVSRIFVAEETWEGGPNGTLPAVRTEAVAL